MELREYGRILSRRWWLVALLLAIVLLASLPSLLAPQPTRYQAAMRFAIGVRPEPSTGDYYTYDRYYTWLASEYLVDDLAEILKSHLFARAVSERLALQSIEVPVGAIQGSTQAGKLHRILSVNVDGGNEQELRLVANAIVEVLRAQSGVFLAQLGSENAEIALIDPPVVFPVGQSLKDRLDLPIRLFLALLAGVALAFLLDYLDQSVRDRQELEALGVPLLAEVPRQPRKGGLWGRQRQP